LRSEVINQQSCPIPNILAFWMLEANDELIPKNVTEDREELANAYKSSYET
jgi:hypothetical protein